MDVFIAAVYGGGAAYIMASRPGFNGVFSGMLWPIALGAWAAKVVDEAARQEPPR